MLWLDQGTPKELRQPERVLTSAAKAAAQFRKRFGTPATVVYIHPESAAEEFVVVVNGRNVRVVPKKGTLHKTYRVCKEPDPNDKDGNSTRRRTESTNRLVS